MGYPRALRHACAVAAIAGLAAPATAELTKSDKIIGDWHVYTEVDSMTDRLTCAAFYKDSVDVHLSPRALHINYRGRGGWDGYRYRIGDGKPTLGPSNTYRRSDFITFNGRDLKKAVEAGRLRVQVATYINGVINEDIDLKDAASALEAMTAMGCQ